MPLDRQRNLFIVVVVVTAALLIVGLYTRHSGPSTVPDQLAKVAIPASLQFESAQHYATNPDTWTYNYRTSDSADQVFAELKSAFQKAGYNVTGSAENFYADNGLVQVQSNLVTQSSPEHTITIVAEGMSR